MSLTTLRAYAQVMPERRKVLANKMGALLLQPPVRNRVCWMNAPRCWNSVGSYSRGTRETRTSATKRTGHQGHYSGGLLHSADLLHRTTSTYVVLLACSDVF